MDTVSDAVAQLLGVGSRVGAFIVDPVTSPTGEGVGPPETEPLGWAAAGPAECVSKTPVEEAGWQRLKGQRRVGTLGVLMDAGPVADQWWHWPETQSLNLCRDRP